MLVLGKPLGVGVLSAALKKDALDAAGYAQHDRQHDASSTRRASRWPTLAGVHALTDVTGFGLAGHALELARGAGGRRAHRLGEGAAARRGARARGTRHGDRRLGPQLGRATARDVVLPDGFDAADRALLTDPQTSGGLLVACAPTAVRDVLAVFAAEGFERAAVVGEVTAGPARLTVRP